MNKKAQFDIPIVTFALVVIGLLIMAPIMLKIFNEINTNVGDALGNVTGAGGTIAKANFNKVMDTAVSFWDKVILVAFIISILLLFVSAFMIDAHPLFIILYIFVGFMLILFAPNIIEAVDVIYTSSTFGAEVSQLQFLDTIRTHYAEFLIGIMVITGIIIYGKLSFFGRNK